MYRILVLLSLLSYWLVATNAFVITRPPVTHAATSYDGRVITRTLKFVATDSSNQESSSSFDPIEKDWLTFRSQNLSSFQAYFNELDLKRKQPKFQSLIFSRLLAWALRKLVRSCTNYVTGLDIRVNAESNQAIVRGKIDTIDMKFDKISYAQIFVSGGGRIIVKNLNLRMRRFLFFRKLQAIRKPYMIYCDLLVTQEDIINSKFIRGLIQLLVNTILERVFLNANKILSASIRKVTINSRRINAQGTAKLLSNSPDGSGLASVDFEVSTSAGMKEEGQILYLKDIQVVLNPDSILRTIVPIVTTAPIDVDLGDDFRIESLVIANRNIWIRAASVISPVEPFAVTETSSKALYKYDLSALLSSMLRLNGGIAMRWRPNS